MKNTLTTVNVVKLTQQLLLPDARLNTYILQSEAGVILLFGYHVIHTVNGNTKRIFMDLTFGTTKYIQR